MLDSKEIKNKIDFTIKMVNNIEPEYRVEAFKIILEHSLQNTLTSSTNTNSLPPTTPSQNNLQNRLLVDTGITQDELGNVMSIEDETVHIHSTFNDSDRKNMINFSQCYMLGKFYFFRQEWVKSDELISALHSVGIEDKNHNFTTHLKSDSKTFAKRGSKNTLEFRLTVPFGRKESLALLKNLAKN